MKAQNSHSVLSKVIPNRVRRNYRGGLLLEQMSGIGRGDASDDFRPEFWIASTTPAINSGLPEIENEGLTQIVDQKGNCLLLREIIHSEPEFYMGKESAGKQRNELGFLAKLLDSAVRLQVQAHPTSAFARSHLGKPFGKLEAYYILDVREGVSPYILLGFQRSPGRQKWREIIESQDLQAMKACFDPIPVNKGEVWLIPGGLPHAIGEGILMVELMEPSDLVVRCEFIRDGMEVPESARYMGRNLDFCLDIFDYAAYSPEEVRDRFLLSSGPSQNCSFNSIDELIGPAHTNAFVCRRILTTDPLNLGNLEKIGVFIQTAGTCLITDGVEAVTLRAGETCIAAAAARNLQLLPQSARCETLWVFPGSGD